jgi:murein endopeptidase
MPGPRNWPKVGGATWALSALLAVLSGYFASAGTTPAAASGNPAAPATSIARVRTEAPGADAATRGSAILPLVTVTPEPHPLGHLSARELELLARRAPEQLGPATLGSPNRGRLLNGVPLTATHGVHVVNDSQSYGTPATVRSIQSAVAEVLRSFPDSRPLFVGDLSRRGGGYLRPHRSHQTGVDADLGYYYLNAERWYTQATAENLDRARTWALLKALVSQGNVQYVFMDRSVQQLLVEYALAQGEPPELVSTLFESTQNRTALVRHARLHLTHFHVRFHDFLAEETGRRLLPCWRRLRRI